MVAIKKQKPPVVEVTPEMVQKAASTTFMLDLLHIASAVSRAAIHGPFKTELPLLAAAWIKEKQDYRRVNVPAGMTVNLKEIVISKRNGLIFRFDIAGTLQRTANENVEFYEINWGDVINTVGDFADRVDANRTDEVTVESVDSRLKEAIKRNPAMHQILSDGFKLALSTSREKAMDEGIQDIPGFGEF